LSVSEDVDISDNKFLLFYWNQDSQFIFGENNLIEFGFHHLIIKFLEMINYYKTHLLPLKTVWKNTNKNPSIWLRWVNMDVERARSAAVLP
jgi:hypothetical protein